MSLKTAEGTLQAGAMSGAGERKARVDRSLVHSIAWTGVVKWVTQILTWGSTLIVARLLTPSDYGLVAIASTFIGFVTMINEFGLGTAVITKRDLSHEQIAQLNSMAVLLGVAGFLVSCALAEPMSRIFDAPALTWVLVAMGASFLIGAFKTVPSALLEKDLQFKPLALIEGGQAIIASLAVIILAFLGFGYWALVLGIVVGTAAWTILTLRLRTYAFQWPVLRSLGETLTLSWHLIVMRVTWYTASNADRFIVGKLLGQAALGSYSFASIFANLPLDKIAGLISRVTPAFYSSVQTDHGTLRRYILSLTEGLALVTFPATVGLALVAEDFIRLLLGPQWGDVVLPLQVLACYVAVRSVMTILSPVLLATGLSRYGMMNSIWSFVLLLPAFFIGSRWGLVGVAVAWLVVYPLVTVPLYTVMFRHIGLSVWQYLPALWPALSATLVMVTCVLGARFLTPNEWPHLARLIALTAVGGVAYLGTVWVLHRARLMAFVQLIREARHS